MALPERCPNCGSQNTVRRTTVNLMEPDEWSFLYCAKPGCWYNVEEMG